MKIAHIINPVNAPPTSDLYIAQPITFETMRRAREAAQGIVDVELYTTQYPEDHDSLPEDFTVLEDLDRSALDLSNFNIPRKLPFLRDILDRLYEASDADYLIYTNVDIALMPFFYIAVARMLTEHDAIIINRRNISNEYTSVDDILLMQAEVGEESLGNDCFVFRREAYPHFELGDVIVGISGLEMPLYANMVVFANNFREYSEAHLTFHLGNAKIWVDEKYDDYTAHNQRELLKSLILLREQAGRVDHTTALGRYLLDRYQRHDYLNYAADFLLQDNDFLPAKVYQKTRLPFILRLKRAIKLVLTP